MIEQHAPGTRPKVVIAETIADRAVELLEDDHEVDIAVDVERPELLRRMADAAALIVRSATKVDEELIAAAPRLRVIGRAGIGVDNIDVTAATRAGVLVVNAPDANTISAAEHTMALMLAQARRIPEADAALRAGRWERKRLQGTELHGKVLGIIGLGKIGTLVAQRASAFGMELIAYDPYVGEDRARRLGIEMTSLDDVLSRADIITVHLPRTRETEGLIDADALARTKPGVRILNVARGGIVDEDALAAAVASGHVAGAGIDVFAEEPTTSSPLFAFPQVVVSPHLGASTREAQDKAGIAVAEAVAAALRDELVGSAVNVDLGDRVPDEVYPYLSLAEKLGRVFVTFARGMPQELSVVTLGRLADAPIKPFSLSALKGALATVTEEPVSFVNAPMLASSRGLRVREEARPERVDYTAAIRLEGDVEGKPRAVAGTYMARKGPVLIEVDGYEIELPITEHMLLIRNDDRPGVIGRVGTYLGQQGINISDMVVGRSPAGEAAMMGLSLASTLDDAQVAGLLDLEGVLAARYIDLV